MTSATAPKKDPHLVVPEHLADKIRCWAVETGRDPQRVLEHILERYFRRDDYEAAVAEGLEQADAGLTLSHEAVEKYFSTRKRSSK